MFFVFVATRCGDSFVFCSIRCFNIVFTGSCPALRPLKSIDCGYSLEPPRRGGSNEYPQSCWGRGSWLYCVSLVCGLCIVCRGLFVLSLGVIVRLYSVTGALHGHLLY